MFVHELHEFTRIEIFTNSYTFFFENRFGKMKKIVSDLIVDIKIMFTFALFKVDIK